MTGRNELHAKLQVLVANKPGISEGIVFGLDGFLLNGNLCCAVDGDALLLRLDRKTYQFALNRSGFSPFLLSGQPLQGWLLVDANCLDAHELLVWVEKACEYVGSLTDG